MFAKIYQQRATYPIEFLSQFNTSVALINECLQVFRRVGK